MVDKEEAQCLWWPAVLPLPHTVYADGSDRFSNSTLKTIRPIPAPSTFLPEERHVQHQRGVTYPVVAHQSDNDGMEEKNKHGQARGSDGSRSEWRNLSQRPPFLSGFEIKVYTAARRLMLAASSYLCTRMPTTAPLSGKYSAENESQTQQIPSSTPAATTPYMMFGLQPDGHVLHRRKGRLQPAITVSDLAMALEAAGLALIHSIFEGRQRASASAISNAEYRNITRGGQSRPDTIIYRSEHGNVIDRSDCERVQRLDAADQSAILQFIEQTMSLFVRHVEVYIQRSSHTDAPSSSSSSSSSSNLTLSSPLFLSTLSRSAIDKENVVSNGKDQCREHVLALASHVLTSLHSLEILCNQSQTTSTASEFSSIVYGTILYHPYDTLP